MSFRKKFDSAKVVSFLNEKTTIFSPFVVSRFVCCWIFNMRYNQLYYIIIIGYYSIIITFVVGLLLDIQYAFAECDLSVCVYYRVYTYLEAGSRRGSAV